MTTPDTQILTTYTPHELHVSKYSTGWDEPYLRRRQLSFDDLLDSVLDTNKHATQFMAGVNILGASLIGAAMHPLDELTPLEQVNRAEINRLRDTITRLSEQHGRGMVRLGQMAVLISALSAVVTLFSGTYLLHPVLAIMLLVGGMGMSVFGFTYRMEADESTLK